ncbi:hypothetical protein VTN77DRAFT_8668 [Rasamsonia byssochlamydoides]|uniref:uncharacterized protein n=1 Tax=Rasamsonia byssochlamydoides TaxID=89139 RepID=UPI003744A133
MWEIIAGAAAGVVGVLVAWVGCGYLDLNLGVNPYEQRQRHLQGEREKDGGGDDLNDMTPGETKVSYSVKKGAHVSDTTTIKDDMSVERDRDSDRVQVQHEVGSGSDSDQVGVVGGGGGFFGKKRELVNMSVIP